MDKLEDAVPRAAERLDALRAAGLRGLGRLVEARAAGLERERARLARSLGAEHPRVEDVAARAAQAGSLRHEVARQVARAEAVRPATAPDAWVVYGLVLRPDLSPASAVSVSLADQRGQEIPALGSACTDAHGSFRLTAKVERSPDATAAAAPAFLRVTDADGHELHLSREPLQVTAGTAQYVEIVLTAPAADCTPRKGPAPEPARPAAATRKPGAHKKQGKG